MRAEVRAEASKHRVGGQSQQLMTTLEDKGRHTRTTHTGAYRQSKGQEVVETMPYLQNEKPNEKLNYGRKKSMKEQRRQQGEQIR